MARKLLFGKSSLLIVSFFLFMIAPAIGRAQTIDTEQRIFMPTFHTLLVSNEINELSLPVAGTDQAETILISFDELAGDARDLRYSLIHCTSDWQPSGLVESEFISGFNEAKVEDFEFSRATLTHYVHYTVRVPDELKPLLPGNYLIVVESDRYPYDKILQARFSLSENSIGVSGKVDARTDIDYLSTHQQISLTLDLANSQVDNPYTDLIVEIMQNDRPSTKRILKSPTRVEGRKAVYEHLDDLIFEAGNEYRRMEIVDTEYPGLGVESIRRTPGGFFAELTPDRSKSEEAYVYDETQKGKFFIREYNSENSSNEADYIDVTFSLKSQLIPEADLFLEGELTGRKLDDTSKMDYDDATHSYIKRLYLKQGAYNYKYILSDKNRPGQTKDFDGDKWQTKNDYTVKVYYKKPGERYERLGGVGIISFE